MIVKKYLRTKGIPMYVKEEEYKDEKITMLQRYSSKGMRYSDKLSHIDRAELVDHLSQCTKGE